MPHSACVRCPTCDGFPCLVHAKSDAEVLAVRPALEHPERHAAHQRARARCWTTDAVRHATVTEVDVRRRRRAAALPADIVVVSCGAANSAALLLASASDRHPRGLANGSDQVGRNYMFHNSQAVLALSREENPTRLPEDARAQRLLLRHPTASSTRSGNIQMVGKSRRRCTAARSRCETKLAPMFDARRRGAARGRLLAVDRGPSAAENRVTLAERRPRSA